MSQISSESIHTLKQQIAAGRRRLQKLWDARHTESGGISDADILAAIIEWTS